MPAQPYLLILGSSQGLSWVLENERMAFRASNAARASRLEVGDRLFLYTTKGCFGDLNNGQGRIIGEAEVVTPVSHRVRPARIGGQDFDYDCQIALESLAPFGEGVELIPLLTELEAFPDPRSYSAHLRRPLLPLPAADAKLIR